MRRSAVPGQLAAQSTSKNFPAPVRGWVENENLALAQGIAATVLENAFPGVDTVRVRRGMQHVASCGAAVRTLIPFHSAGAFDRLFAATDAALHEVSLFDPSTTAPVRWRHSSGRYTAVQIDTGGGQFAVAANGIDPWIYYNGADWLPIASTAIHRVAYDALTQAFVVGRTLSGSGASGTIVAVQPDTATTGVLLVRAVTGTFADNVALTGNSGGGAATANGASVLASAVTITGVDTSLLHHVWIHGNRIWACRRDSMTAWFLPVDSIGGAAEDFNLGGVFQRGGYLAFGGTWSADSGSGLNDRCVFVSSLGEVAVFQGYNPGDPDNWSIVGRYDLGVPATTETLRAGGDLLIGTSDGLVPMSAVVQKDPAGIAAAAVTYPIQPSWMRAARTGQVHIAKWQRESMGLIGVPARREAYVVNLTTNAWAKWTGLDMQALGVMGQRAFYADAQGRVFEIEAAGSDNGLPYVVRIGLQPDHLNSPGALKTVHQARAIFRAFRPFEARLSVATDYRTEFPTPPNVAPAGSAIPSVWGAGQWDAAIWDDGVDTEIRRTATTRWRSIGRTGISASPQVQITIGSQRRPDAELVAIELTFTQGGLVV